MIRFGHQQILLRVLLFSAMLLLMQTSAILHDVDHVSHEHTSSCDLFIVADKVGTLTAGGYLFVPDAFSNYFNATKLPISITAVARTYDARGPPLSPNA